MTHKEHLMTIYACHDCLGDVPPGEALVRSITFKQVAYCRECWEKNHLGLVPPQRRSPEHAPAPLAQRA